MARRSSCSLIPCKRKVWCRSDAHRYPQRTASNTSSGRWRRRACSAARWSAKFHRVLRAAITQYSTYAPSWEIGASLTMTTRDAGTADTGEV